MDNDYDSSNNQEQWRQGAFPVDKPIEALRRDHDLVRKLAERYLDSDHPQVRKQAATQILQALHNHSRLEETIFYPGVREIDADLIARFEQDHLKVDDLLSTLQGMSLDDPHSERLMHELLEAAMQHIQEEENELFAKLEQARLDLAPLGLQMQAFEANLIHMQAQASARGANR